MSWSITKEQPWKSLEMVSISKNTMHDLQPRLLVVYYCTTFLHSQVLFIVIRFVISFYFLWQMSMQSSTYIGFADGASRHTQHSASAAWVIYTPMGQVLSSGGACLRPCSNNVAEYNVVIELLWDAILHGVLSLEVHIDLQLVVSQLNGLYHVRDLKLLRRFLRVRLLERQFDNITSIHVPRINNQVADSYAN